MPTKKPLKKTRPSAPVDLRTPAEIAVDELRRSVRDIRKDADDNGAALEAFAVELRGDLAAALLDEIDRVARAAKLAASAWESEDLPAMNRALDELRLARGGEVVRTREKPAKEPAEAQPRPYEIVQPPAWLRPKEHHKTNTNIFYARPKSKVVYQGIFAIDRTGAMFLDRCEHTPIERRDLRAGDLIALPACVLEVLAVEARKKEDAS